MKKLTQQEINTINKQHSIWVASGTKQGTFADYTTCDISGMCFKNAHLPGVSFKGANCTNTDFTRATLYNACFKDADLAGAKLIDAEICRVTGDGKYIKNIELPTYPVTYTNSILQISYINDNIKEWVNFTDSDITDMDLLDWWNIHKEHILNTIKNNPAK